VWGARVAQPFWRASIEEQGQIFTAANVVAAAAKRRTRLSYENGMLLEKSMAIVDAFFVVQMRELACPGWASQTRLQSVTLDKHSYQLSVPANYVGLPQLDLVDWGAAESPIEHLRDRCRMPTPMFIDIMDVISRRQPPPHIFNIDPSLSSCRNNVIVENTAAAKVTQNVGIHPGQEGSF
jgi:hypothetical protein